MKNYLLDIVTIALMVLVSVGFSACDASSDGKWRGPGINGGNGSIVVNDETIGVYFGYCSHSGGKCYLDFYNWNLDNPRSFPGTENIVSIDFEGFYGEVLPLGEFDKFHVSVIKGKTSDNEGVHWEANTEYSNPTDSKLIIKQNNNKYTISFSGLSIGDGEESFENTSFSYSGIMTEKWNFEDFLDFEE